MSSGLQVLSADFRRTSSEARQRFAESFDAHWIAESGLEEAMWLSTCNRAELYLRGSSERVRELLAERDGEIWFGQGRSAMEQLYRVSSGLESAVLGESEIVAQ